MSTDAFEQLIDVAAPFEQLIDVAAPGGGSYPVQRGHRRGVRSPHTFDAARWPPSSLTSPYAPQGSTTAVLAGLSELLATDYAVEESDDACVVHLSDWRADRASRPENRAPVDVFRAGGAPSSSGAGPRRKTSPGRIPESDASAVQASR